MNRAERRMRARAADVKARNDSAYWRARYDGAVTLLEGLVYQAGGRLRLTDTALAAIDKRGIEVIAEDGGHTLRLAPKQEEEPNETSSGPEPADAPGPAIRRVGVAPAVDLREL